MFRRTSCPAIPRWNIARQEAAAQKFFGIARVEGPGHIDFDTLCEAVLATIPEHIGPDPRPHIRQSTTWVVARGRQPVLSR